MVGNAMGGEGTTLTSLYLQIQVGGDLALLKGMMKVIIAADETARAAGGKPVLDDAFIATHTYGLDALIADLKAEPWERILAQSGVSRDEIARAADIYINAGRVICTWAMGLTQHAMGVETIQQIINLLLLRGNIGRPGTGPCPVRGHSNVQGDRTMGITELPKQEFLDSLRRVFGFTPPSKPGVNTVEAIAAMRDGKAKALLAMGGNFAAACPDSDVTWAGLRAQSHRSCLNQAQSQSLSPRQDGADFSSLGTHRDRHPKDWTPSHHGGRLHEHGSRQPRNELACLRSVAIGTLDHCGHCHGNLAHIKSAVGHLAR